MTSRWALMFVSFAVAGLALAGATAAGTPQATVPGPAATASPAQAPVESGGDPYLGGAALSTEAPIPTTSCQIYAYQCSIDGGPCGILGACHCKFTYDLGWICAR